MVVVQGSGLAGTAVLQLPSLLLLDGRGGLKNSPKPPGSQPWYGGLPGNWSDCVYSMCVGVCVGGRALGCNPATEKHNVGGLIFILSLSCSFGCGHLPRFYATRSKCHFPFLQPA